MPRYRRKHNKNVKSYAVKRDGGLAVSFINTATEEHPLKDYADLLAWARQQQAIEGAIIDHLEGLAAERPEEADTAFADATELHGHLSSIFNARADREALPQSAIEGFESYLNRRPPRRLFADEGCCRLTWDDDDLFRPLVGVMSSAVNVLISKKLLRRVTRCAREGCETLFVARNGGKPRKWCNEKSCGNRVRTLHHYHSKVKPRKVKIRKYAEERVQKLMTDPEGAQRDFDERVRRIKGE